MTVLFFLLILRYMGTRPETTCQGSLPLPFKMWSEVYRHNTSSNWWNNMNLWSSSVLSTLHWRDDSLNVAVTIYSNDCLIFPELKRLFELFSRRHMDKPSITFYGLVHRYTGIFKSTFSPLNLKKSLCLHHLPFTKYLCPFNTIDNVGKALISMSGQ